MKVFLTNNKDFILVFFTDNRFFVNFERNCRLILHDEGRLVRRRIGWRLSPGLDCGHLLILRVVGLEAAEDAALARLKIVTCLLNLFFYLNCQNRFT